MSTICGQPQFDNKRLTRGKKTVLRDLGIPWDAKISIRKSPESLNATADGRSVTVVPATSGTHSIAYDVTYSDGSSEFFRANFVVVDAPSNPTPTPDPIPDKNGEDSDGSSTLDIISFIIGVLAILGVGGAIATFLLPQINR